MDTVTPVVFWLAATLILDKAQPYAFKTREACVAAVMAAELIMASDGDGDGDGLVDCTPVEVRFREAGAPQ